MLYCYHSVVASSGESDSESDSEIDNENDDLSQSEIENVIPKSNLSVQYRFYHVKGILKRY